MSDGSQFWDIILFAMVAGFIVLRLRSVLGRRPEDDSRPANETAPGSSSGADLPGGQPETPPASDNVIRLESDPTLRDAYRDIMRAEPGFDVDGFLEGAKEAYPLILEAFWSGERDTLKGFLSKEVFAQFDTAIDEREAAGMTVENRIIDVTEADIIRAQLIGKDIELTLRFEAELVSLTRDAEGNVIEGNLSDTVRAIDVWTFARPARSRDPNWTLVATGDE